MLVLLSPTSGGVISRRLLLAPVVIPLFLGSLRIFSGHLISDQDPFLQWLFAISNLSILTILVWVTAAILYRNDLRRFEGEAELQAAYASMESFSYSVSHDLRGPLRVMGSYLEVIEEDCGKILPKEARDHLQRAQRNVVRMNDLIEGILKFSRFSHVPLARTQLDLKPMVREAYAELRAAESDRKVELAVRDLPLCYGDAVLVRQVFTNLISNALKFTRTRPAATIEVGSEPYPEKSGYRTYYVHDDGPGFDPAGKAKLFGVFQRLPEAAAVEGTGVGLSLSSNIVKRHGGKIWADSEPGKFARFSFTLPTQRGISAWGRRRRFDALGWRKCSSTFRARSFDLRPSGTMPV